MSTLDHKFNAVAAATPQKKPRSAPFSLRLSFEEKALLRAAANGVPLGAYIKAKLFDEPLEKVRRRNTNPVKDHEALGRLLGSLGQSRLSQNLNQLVGSARESAETQTRDELRAHPRVRGADRQAGKAEDRLERKGLESGLNQARQE